MLDDAVSVLMEGIEILLNADATAEREARAARFRLEADVQWMRTA